MKNITKIAGAVGTKLCDRSRSVKFRLLEIGRATRAKGAINRDRFKNVVKRRNGLSRCRYKGCAGMHRWVGLGVIADTLINIGRAVEEAAGS